MLNFFISDTHFGHERALSFDNRPFKTVDEMFEKMRAKWNAKVTNEDDVWIIGDFSYRSNVDPSEYLKRLQGKKHLIVGNHDLEMLENKIAISYFDTIDYQYKLIINGLIYILCHYPIADWMMMHYGSYHIYGHIHSDRNDVYKFMTAGDRGQHAFNAGCMINNYEPVTVDELVMNNIIFRQGCE